MHHGLCAARSARRGALLYERMEYVILAGHYNVRAFASNHFARQPPAGPAPSLSVWLCNARARVQALEKELLEVCEKVRLLETQSQISHGLLARVNTVSPSRC